MTMTARGRESSTIFDDVFRTMLERLDNLMIPVINEIFHENYPLDAGLSQLKNEHVTDKMNHATDSHLQIGNISIDGNQYHMECESNPYGNICIRMIEYDFSIALESITETDGTKGLLFPKSCILYLRQTKSTKEKELLKLRFADGTCAEYRVPIVKVQEYTKEQIFDKKLYILLPFYIMRYEKELKSIEDDQIKQDAFICEFDELLNRLRECREIDDTEYSYLLDNIHKVSNHILRHSPALMERIDKVMGGKVLRLRTDVIIEQGLKKGMKQGLEQGLQQGLQQGKLEAYIEMIKDGLITIASAAARLSMSESELEKHMKNM